MGKNETMPECFSKLLPRQKLNIGDPPNASEMPDGILEDRELDSSYVSAEIMREHSRQIEKWDWQTHHIFEWLAYTIEEVGELSKAISEYIYRGGKKDDIVKEAVQVATLAIKIAKMAEEQF